MAKALKGKTGREVLEHFAAAAGAEPSTFLAGKAAVITGGASGIGLETAKVLASAGCRVMITSRSLAKGQQTIRDEIAGGAVKETGKYPVPRAEALVSAHELELSSLTSVRAFAEAVLKEASVIHFLFLNAGDLAEKRGDLPSGLEASSAGRHFGHRYLVNLLMGSLPKKGEGSACGARVVVMTGRVMHFSGGLDASDVNFERRKWAAWAAGKQSMKLNAIFAKSLAEAEPRLTVVSVDPGGVSTHFADKMPGCVGCFMRSLKPLFTDMPHGVATVVMTHLDPAVVSGAHYLDFVESPSCKEAMDPTVRAQAEVSMRACLAKALKKVSLEM